jgi:hypothetical protein
MLLVSVRLCKPVFGPGYLPQLSSSAQRSTGNPTILYPVSRVVMAAKNVIDSLHLPPTCLPTLF